MDEFEFSCWYDGPATSPSESSLTALDVVAGCVVDGNSLLIVSPSESSLLALGVVAGHVVQVGNLMVFVCLT